MISVRNLSKYYGSKRALHNVNIDVRRGEVLGLLGLNGAGKTTCLRILSGFLIPSSGRCIIGDCEIYQDSIAARKQIGYLPETPPLYLEMTVHDYLLFIARMKNISEKSITREINSVIKTTQLGEVKYSYINSLSYGFRKRVGIAQTLIGKPRVIILDEPISGLDPLQIIEIRKLIRSLAGKYTIFISSHILTEVSKTCDRVQLIHKGEIRGELSGVDLKKNLEKSFMKATKKLISLRK